MRHDSQTNSPNIWMDSVPEHIVRSFHDCQAWQSERTEVLGGNTLATVLTDEFCEYTFIQNTHVDAETDTIYYQCYEKTARDLEKMGVSFDHVVRTWIYLDDIDTTYTDFNRQRDQFYREQGVFDRLVPASTAIGISAQNEPKMISHVLALKKRSDQVVVRAVESPLQCSAMDYQVSFSRALEIQTPDYRRLLISGTASINAEGQTVYIDSIEKQTEQTAKVIDALLASNQMELRHITRLLSYTKIAEDCEFTSQFIEKWLPANDGVMNVHADVCRDNLLVEFEAEVVIF